MITLLSESGHERNRNAGDEAYFATMVRLFKDHFNPVRIVAFSDRPERDKSRYGVETVYSGGSVHKTAASFVRMLKTIKACDVYVWGGGQILRDDTGIKSPLYRLHRPLIAKLMGKSVMAYAVGIGPLKTRQARLLAKQVLNTFDVITVRDRMSEALLKQIGVTRPPIHVTVDPAFGASIASREEVAQAIGRLPLDPKAPLVGVAPFGPAFRGVRSLLPAKYQVKLGMWKQGGKARYNEHARAMAVLCDHVVEKYGAAVLLVAQDASWQGLDDRLSADILPHMRHSNMACIVNADDYRPEVLVGIMEKMVMMVGGRMHCLILASCVGTPVLGICFEEKIRSFGDIIGQREYFLDAEEIQDVGRVCSIIDRLWRERAVVSDRLKKGLEGLKAEVDLNVCRLAALAGSKVHPGAEPWITRKCSDTM